MKDNIIKNSFYWVYLTGFCIILTLPLITFPPFLFPVDWGKTMLFRIILSLLLFLFAYQFLYKKDELGLPKIKNPIKNGVSKIIWILLAIILVSFLSTIFSVDANFSFWGSPYRSGGFVNFAFYILFALLTFFVVKEADWDKLWNCSIVTGILVSLIAVIQYFGLFNQVLVTYDNRPPSTLGNPIILGIYLLLLFFLTLIFTVKETKKLKKIFYFCSVLLFLYVILITGSRAAYLGLLIGGIFFILLYPAKNSKKLHIFKIATIIGLCFIALVVFYINNGTSFPKFLEENKIFQSIRPRLSIEMFLQDPRFSAWQVGFSALKEKPILGWGLENFSIGFDKHYNPSLPYISKEWGGWWDRSHNFLLDMAVMIGVPSLIIYLSLFAVLFWMLHKIKSRTENKTTPVIIHGIQATIIGYFIANVFWFDTFTTYLMFFMIVGYSLSLIYSNSENYEISNTPKHIKGKGLIIGILSIFLILFLWQYNFLPLQINAKINEADALIKNKNCDKAFLIMDNILTKHSFLDAYVRSSYVDQIKKCANLYPKNDLTYAKKGIEVLTEAVKIRPLYSRFWIFLGSFTIVQADAEENPETKQNLINEANSYLDKALELAPNHQEIIIEQAKISMINKDYARMAEKAEECIAKEESSGECYWIRAFSEIYLGNLDQAQKDIRTAEEKQFAVNSIFSLYQLVNAYADTKNYQQLASVYEKLITINPDIAEYHSSLAFTYYQLGDYAKARAKAQKFLELMPEAKGEVEMFLKMLPY